MRQKKTTDIKIVDEAVFAQMCDAVYRAVALRLVSESKKNALNQPVCAFFTAIELGRHIRGTWAPPVLPWVLTVMAHRGLLVKINHGRPSDVISSMVRYRLVGAIPHTEVVTNFFVRITDLNELNNYGKHNAFSGPAELGLAALGVAPKVFEPGKRRRSARRIVSDFW